MFNNKSTSTVLNRFLLHIFTAGPLVEKNQAVYVTYKVFPFMIDGLASSSLPIVSKLDLEV